MHKAHLEIEIFLKIPLLPYLYPYLKILAFKSQYSYEIPPTPNLPSNALKFNIHPPRTPDHPTRVTASKARYEYETNGFNLWIVQKPTNMT